MEKILKELVFDFIHIHLILWDSVCTQKQFDDTMGNDGNSFIVGFFLFFKQDPMYQRVIRNPNTKCPS